jgi:hypothetical protein
MPVKLNSCLMVRVCVCVCVGVCVCARVCLYTCVCVLGGGGGGGGGGSMFTSVRIGRLRADLRAWPTGGACVEKNNNVLL